MPIVLIRVDERLIHGQVVVGWGAQIRPDLFVVVDSALVASEWERDLYLLGVPEGVEATFLTPEAARAALPELKASPKRALILARDLETMQIVARGGAMEGESLNLGGIHSRSGREEVLPYLFLDDQDRNRLREIAQAGVRVSARDLPGSHEVPLEALLG